MIHGIHLKICGLTRAEDAQAAAAIGADYLGFVVYPKSPRFITPEAFRALRSELPALPKVAVTVSPDDDSVAELLESGFDVVQIHFPLSQADRVGPWSAAIGKERLWLAPKVGPGDRFDPAWLELAAAILWDTFKADGYGGTGARSDWDRFAALMALYPGTRWILAGGLSGANAAEAVRVAGARFLDMCSGLEIAPGVKSREKLIALSDALGAF